jgi:lysophospholipid acyltransferase (LPLAT)-like uncharacterized protein
MPRARMGCGQFLQMASQILAGSMATDFKSRYRVNEVPWQWWLPMQVYGWISGLVIYLSYCLTFLSSRIHHVGKPAADQNYVYCFWHQQVLTFQSLQLRYKKFALFIHPLWYMYPLQVAARITAVSNLVLGSSGSKGIEAAQTMAQIVRAGDSTYFNPDGPYGPLGKVSKGALHVAMQSEVPIMPMAVVTSPCITLSGWDKNQIDTI